MEAFVLPADIAGELCARLGVAWPAGVGDLEPLYRAWCATVPFDNVSKGLALIEGRDPPGDDAVASAERFLTTGLGGTCWTHVGMLAGLLTAAGARATVGLDRNLRTDGIIDFHSFVVVHEAGEDWMLDPVWCSGRPLPLRAGATGDHPIVATGIGAAGEPGSGRLDHWAQPAQGECVRYRVLATGLDRDDARAFCVVSGRFSGVPIDGLRLGLTYPDRKEGLRPAGPGPDHAGPDRPVMWVHRRTAAGTTDEPFTDADAAFAALGCTPDARRLAERAGLLTLAPA